MKDLHSHILNGIDDGARNITDSLNMLKKAQEYGVTDIVLTSHYINESKYDADVSARLKLYTELKELASKENININLYLGNEIYIDENVPKLLRENRASSLNGSKYILIELPLRCKCNILDEALYEIFDNGYIPVIAHPERYTYYQDNIDFFKDLVDRGCLLQANVGSLKKVYGSSAKKMLIKLLKNDLIYCFGCDAHNSEDYKRLKGVGKALLKIVKNEKRVLELLESNFDKIINS